MNNPFDHSDIIDSRDVVGYLGHLKDELEDMTGDSLDHLQLDIDKLQEFVNTCEKYSSDWEYGVSIIPEAKWVDYVKDMLIDIGYIPKDIPGFIEIDWEATAENIKVDYVDVEYDGEKFFLLNI